MYLRRDYSGRVLSPGPGCWSRPSPAPEEWTHFISLSITPTSYTCYTTVYTRAPQFWLRYSFLVERACQRFQTLKNNLAGNGASGDLNRIDVKIEAPHCIYSCVYIICKSTEVYSLTLVAGREIESINKLANDISIYPQRRSLSTVKLILFRITLLCSTFKINFIHPCISSGHWWG